MKYFIFILKTVGISLPISALLGYIKSLFEPAGNPHFPFDPWMSTVPLAVLLSLLTGTIIGGVLSATKKANLWYSVLVTVGFVGLALVQDKTMLYYLDFVGFVDDIISFLFF
jgi:hypothetical protein